MNPAFTRRLAGIEGLRAIAALGVLTTHTMGFSQPGGGSFGSALGGPAPYVQQLSHHGVVLFFALSGFLLYLPFASALLQDERRPAFSAYLRNRALRILPAYWFALFCAALILKAVDTGFGQVGALTDPGLLARNALLIQKYDPDTLGTGVGAMWSLAVEVVFYVTLPLLVMAATWLWKRNRRWALYAPALIMGFIGMVSLAAGPKGVGTAASWERVWDLSIFTHAHLFALGLGLAVIRAEWQNGKPLPSSWRPATITALIVAVVVLIGEIGIDAVPERIEVCIVALVCALVLALTVLEPAKLARFLDTRVLLGAGVISYGIFLWHVPVIYLLRENGVTIDGGYGALAFNLTAVIAVTVAFAWISWKLVEQPALRHKARRREPKHGDTSPRAAAVHGPAVE